MMSQRSVGSCTRCTHAVHSLKRGWLFRIKSFACPTSGIVFVLNVETTFFLPQTWKFEVSLIPASGIEVSNRQKTILDREGSAIKSHEINADKWNKNWLVDRDICKYYVLHAYYVGMPRSSWHIILGKPRKTIFWEVIGFGSLLGAMNKFYFCSRH